MCCCEGYAEIHPISASTQIEAMKRAEGDIGQNILHTPYATPNTATARECGVTMPQTHISNIGRIATHGRGPYGQGIAR